MNAVVDTLSLPIKVSRGTLIYWAEQLEIASKIKGGAMDSDRRLLELESSIRLIAATIAEDIRGNI